MRNSDPRSACNFIAAACAWHWVAIVPPCSSQAIDKDPKNGECRPDETLAHQYRVLPFGTSFVQSVLVPCKLKFRAFDCSFLKLGPKPVFCCHVADFSLLALPGKLPNMWRKDSASERVG